MIGRIPEEPVVVLDKRTLVIADLHIGFESELAERGIKIPDQSSKILRRILDLKLRLKTSDLVILGDLKHSVPGIHALSWLEVPRFMERIVGTFDRVIFIPGNHDGDVESLLPRKVETMPVEGMAIGDTWLTHGHTKLSEKAFERSVVLMGHIHPAIQLRDASGYSYAYRVWLRGRFNREPRPEVMILPAFNEYVGQMLLNKGEGFHMDRGPIFSERILSIEDLDVESLDLTYLGKLGSLRP